MERKLLIIACMLILSVTVKVYGQKDDIKPSPQVDKIDSSKFATVYIYRKNKPSGSKDWYNLFMDDSDEAGREIKIIRNNCVHSIKVFREGPTTFWAHIEVKAATTINVKFGKAYYLRCGIYTGLVKPRPKLELIQGPKGRSEYDEVARNSD